MKLNLKPLSNKKILEMSYGEVVVDDTISLRNNKPYNGGIFCERIFGPLEDFKCSCKTNLNINLINRVCPKCGISITKSSERKERFAHINLQFPVINTLCTKLLSNILEISEKSLLKISLGDIYFKIIKIDNKDSKINLIFKDKIKRQLFLFKPDEIDSNQDKFEYLTSSYELYKYVSLIDMEKILEKLGDNSVHSTIKLLFDNDLTIEDLFIKNLPVLPPVFRPMIIKDNIIFSKSYNEFYLRILRSVIRIKSILNNNKDYDPVLLIEESTVLQKSVNMLLITGSKYKTTPLPSIFEALTSKSGIFRGNLLGKRVDFSGRSVIVSSPELHMNYLKVPEEMLYELFKPFILNFLISEYDMKFREALYRYTTKHSLATFTLNKVIKDKVILMNRQPSLHRYSIMAFYIISHTKKFIGLPPIICSPFGADFDGDTVALHLPLSDVAQEESKKLLLPSNNLIDISSGELLMGLSHEAIIGVYYMTNIIKQEKPIIEKSLKRLEILLDSDVININTEILFKYYEENIPESTCLGRLILGHLLNVRINEILTKTIINKYIYNFVINNTAELSSNVLHEITQLAFKYATKSGLSISYDDCNQLSQIKLPEFSEANKYEDSLNEKVALNLLPKNIAKEYTIRNWNKVINDLDNNFLKTYSNNSLSIMFKTGSRLSKTQFSQILTAKGIYTTAKGEISEHPILNSYANGLPIHDYFKSCSAAHKAMTDKKFITPMSGYLARQLVSATREILITDFDCKTTKSLKILTKDSIGRFLSNGELITEFADSQYVDVRSPITCESKTGGICQKCYGIDKSKNSLIQINSRIGLTAAQSISAPATQLSMKSKHTSGSVNIKDKEFVLISKYHGIAKIVPINKKIIKLVVNDEIFYLLMNKNLHLQISNGDIIKPGTELAQYSEDILNSDISGTLPIIQRILNTSFHKICGLYSFISGKVSLKESLTDIKIFVDSRYIGKTTNLISVADGEEVKKGDYLSSGYINIKDFFKETNDLQLSGFLWINQLKNIYLNEKINISSIHFEIIFRAMTEIVSINKKMSLRSIENGYINLMGISNIAKKYPSWLKSAGFGYSKSRIKKAVENMETSIGCETEKIMAGELTPILHD